MSSTKKCKVTHTETSSELPGTHTEPEITGTIGKTKARLLHRSTQIVISRVRIMIMAIVTFTLAFIMVKMVTGDTITSSHK